MTDERTAGRVILLNGGSSAGKTTIGRKLQETLTDSWLLVGIDLFLWMLPSRLMYQPGGLDIVDGVITRGDEFMRIYDAFRESVSALASAGVDVIVDEVTLDASHDQHRWDAALDDLEVCWVGVRCSPDTVAAREADRGDRPPGIARRQATAVHEGMRYDIEVDTDALDLAQSVAMIAEVLKARWDVTGGAATSDAPELPVLSALTPDGEITVAPWER